jgi:Dolichyl-phosphate-mannose-protein mannosyltransferase
VLKPRNTCSHSLGSREHERRRHRGDSERSGIRVKGKNEVMIDTSLPQQAIETKKITRKQRLSGTTLSRWSLPLILAFQTLLSWILLQNTAFQDEALYVYAGRQIWQQWLGGPPSLDHYSYYFSGYPYVYPIIGGGLDLLGGLELARSFSLVCMLLVTTCGYCVTKKLFNQKSAVFAAIFFVCQGPVLFLSRLATFDALCLCLLAIGTTLAVNSSLARRPWLALSVGPFVVLAFGAKYAALLFIPSVLAILVVCTFLKRGWKSMLVRGTLGVLSLLVVGTLTAIVVTHLDSYVLHALSATTTNREAILSATRLGLTEHVIQMVGLSFAVGLLGLACAGKKHLLIVLLFFGSALLIPGYHIYKAEQISLDKHLGYSMFFLMPVAGYALSSLSNSHNAFSSARHWLSGMAICLMLFLVATGEAQNMYSSWPTTSGLAYALNTQVRPAAGRYLAEQFEVSRYNLRENTYNWQWTGLDFFEYTDKQGRYYVGRDAYIKAINDGYFDLIQLNYGFNAQTAVVILQAIEQSKKYQLIDKIPYQDSYGSGYFWIWGKR